MLEIMKLSFLLFFSFATPLALFLGTILYGGITNDNIKKALAQSPVYTQISNHFKNQDAQVVTQKQFSPIFVSKRLTPEYIKTKTESTIDDSTNWVTGKSQTVPVLSLNELKTDMQREHPELLKAIEHVPTESELKGSNLNEKELDRYLEQATQLSSFAKADFTLTLDRHLEGFKLVYEVLQIALPLLVVLLICSLLMLAKLANGVPAKFKWIGAALLTSSIVGFGCIFLTTYISSTIAQTNLLELSDFLMLFTPIIITVLNHYLAVYTGYQITASTVLLVCAGVCFLSAVLTRKQAAPIIKPLNVEHSYWVQPIKEIEPEPSGESKNSK